MKKFELKIIDKKEGLVLLEAFDTIKEVKDTMVGFGELKTTEHWEIVEYDADNNVANEDIIYSRNIVKLLA